MKISQTELNGIASMMLASGKIASSNLTVERLQKTIESGSAEFTGGLRYDTPKLSALALAVQSAVANLATKLVAKDSVSRLVGSSLKTAERKDSSIFILRQERHDTGTALPGVAWLHRMNRYRSSVLKTGIPNSQARKALVEEFGKLKAGDFAALNVSDGKAGFGLVKAREIVTDFSSAETEWKGVFAARQATLASASQPAPASAKAKAKASGKTHKPYSVTKASGKDKAKAKAKAKATESVFVSGVRQSLRANSPTPAPAPTPAVAA